MVYAQALALPTDLDIRGNTGTLRVNKHIVTVRVRVQSTVTYSSSSAGRCCLSRGMRDAQQHRTCC